MRATARKLNLSFEGSQPDESQFIPVPLSAVPLDAALSYSVYVKAESKAGREFIPFRVPGESFPSATIGMVKEQLDTIYIPRMAWPQFIKSVRGFDPVTGPKDLASQIEIARTLFLVYFTDAEVKETLDRSGLERFRLLSEWITNALRGLKSLKSHLTRFNDSSLYFSNHSFNVSLCACVVAHRLGLGNDSVKLVTMGALLHNVGNIGIPHDILHKSSAFTKSEWDSIRAHPRRGGELLYGLGAPREVILTTMQHHERLDGKGYPDLILGHEMHLFAKICSVVDVFDALKSHRPHQDAVDPAEVIQMLSRMERQFEGQILNIVSSLEE